jgi:hypothetical protein
MNEFRATVAIVRRHIDRHFAIDWAMQFGIVAAIAFAFTQTFAHPLFPLAIASVLAAASAAERSHAESLRRLTFFAMPLYGRQLARAHAIAPSLLALAIPAGYAAGSIARTHEFPAALLATMFGAALVSTLVALSSIFRDGLRASLYVVLAAIVGVAVTLPFVLQADYGLALSAALAAIAAFFALRAFGETLARYDPLPLSP